MSGGNWKEMFNAGCEGDLALVEYHVKAGVDVNYAHPEFLSTPLVAAILAGQQEVEVVPPGPIDVVGSVRQQNTQWLSPLTPALIDPRG